MSEEGIWIRTDEITELMDNLEHLMFLLEATVTDRSKWKWVIFALHNSLEGLFVCQLRGNDTIGHSVLEKNSARALLEFVQDRTGLKR